MCTSDIVTLRTILWRSFFSCLRYVDIAKVYRTSKTQNMSCGMLCRYILRYQLHGLAAKTRGQDNSWKSLSLFAITLVRVWGDKNTPDQPAENSLISSLLLCLCYKRLPMTYVKRPRMLRGSDGRIWTLISIWTVIDITVMFCPGARSSAFSRSEGPKR